MDLEEGRLELSGQLVEGEAGISMDASGMAKFRVSSLYRVQQPCTLSLMLDSIGPDDELITRDDVENEDTNTGCWLEAVLLRQLDKRVLKDIDGMRHSRC